MRRTPARRRLTHPSQRGSALLEASLVFLPLLMLFFGIIDVSVAIFMKNTMQYAVREGVRYAITGQTMNGLGQIASIKSVVQSNSMGFLNGNNNGAGVISVTFYNPNSTPTPLAVVTGVGANNTGNVVQVAITGLSWAWIAPVGHAGGSALTISAASSDVMEAPPNGILPTL